MREEGQDWREESSPKNQQHGAPMEGSKSVGTKRDYLHAKICSVLAGSQALGELEWKGKVAGRTCSQSCRTGQDEEHTVAVEQAKAMKWRRGS